MSKHIVNLSWDADAAVWAATSEPIPGLALESGSLDALIVRVRFAVPELMRLNCLGEKNVSLLFRSERLEEVCL